MRTRLSPNHEPRPAGTPVDMLVLHYTGMKSAAEAIERLCDGEAKVSAHYLVEEDGTVWRLVEEDRRAWHAGLSFWRGQRDINGRSVGVEIVNPGHEWGYRDFPVAQMAAVATLCRAILARHPIPPRNVVGHSDIAPLRKQDPGERFDWHWLAGQGVGLWPGELPPGVHAPSPEEAPALLARYGYEVDPSAPEPERLAAVVAAFQRHFRPARVDGVLDAETRAVLGALSASIDG